MLENEEILCISSVDWDPIWTRKQQVMSRLPESNNILYIEPPITLLSPIKDPSRWKKLFRWLKGTRTTKRNIHIYTPPAILPFGNKSRLINKINHWFISQFIKRIAKGLGFKNPILWTYLPNTVDILGNINHKMLVYDCVDDHAEYSGLINKTTVKEMEHTLVSNSDLVFVTAPGLFGGFKGLNKHLYYLPNAANVQHFNKAQVEETMVPEDIASIPGPIIGFIGVIQNWIDLELVEDVAKKHPEWSLVLIGPVGAGIDTTSLKALKNVHFLGRKDLTVLPNYLKAFDVCLNPFKLNALTDKVSPLKFYEYLASGKPIVTVDMPGIRDFSDIVYIAQDKAEFISYIEKALKNETYDKRIQRLIRAQEHTWESRVGYMMDKIAEVNVEIDSKDNLKRETVNETIEIPLQGSLLPNNNPLDSCLSNSSSNI